MEELHKWIAVNKCETFDELRNVVEFIGSVDYSGGRLKSADELKLALDLVRCGSHPVNCITRNYGLRSKVTYLFHYKEK